MIGKRNFALAMTGATPPGSVTGASFCFRGVAERGVLNVCRRGVDCERVRDGEPGLENRRTAPREDAGDGRCERTGYHEAALRRPARVAYDGNRISKGRSSGMYKSRLTFRVCAAIMTSVVVLNAGAGPVDQWALDVAVEKIVYKPGETVQARITIEAPADGSDSAVVKSRLEYGLTQREALPDSSVTLKDGSPMPWKGGVRTGVKAWTGSTHGPYAT